VSTRATRTEISARAPRLRDPDRGEDGDGGFTLIEIIITTAIAVLLLGGFVAVLSGSQALFEQQVQQRSIEQIGRSVMNRLSDEIHAIDPVTVFPTSMNSSPYIEFRTIKGYADSQPVYGPLVRLSWEPVAGETLNGVDDNDDGRVDEGVIAYHESGKRLYDIVGQVTGLRFSSTSNGVSVEVDIGVTDALGNPVERTFSRTVTFRN
jgi:prepilin-type N-terminal cleavage/methylation domain-containing protein